ncbi:MAG: hypothetical protein ABSF61_09715 [Anaerolineales bacterium]|jgi:hypothetical protein
MIRPFELRDLGSVYRLAGQGICLDTRAAFTQEVRSLQSALWGRLLPGTRTRTLFWEGPEGATAFAQMRQRSGSPLARLIYLAPKEIIQLAQATEVIEGVLSEAGRTGAHHLLAEAEEASELFGFLRRQCFAVYARQDLWRQDQALEPTGECPGTLRPGLPTDQLQCHGLYLAVVPGLVQQVEGPPRAGRGWVLLQEDELVGYFRLSSGERGLWVEPFFHPAARGVAEAMQSLLLSLRPRPERPVYVSVRSYQDWLGPILQQAGLSLCGEQAVLVRRIVVPIVESSQVVLSAIEKHATRATPIRSQ